MKQDPNKAKLDLLFATGASVLFLALTALLLWPVHRASLAWHLFKGYCLFVIVLAGTFWVMQLFLRVLRIESNLSDKRYVGTSLALGAFLQLGWAAFAALAVDHFLPGSPTWLVVALWMIGFISTYVALLWAGLFYPAELYKFVNGPIGIVSYVVFAMWPFVGHMLFGWFFKVF